MRERERERAWRLKLAAGTAKKSNEGLAAMARRRTNRLLKNCCCCCCHWTMRQKEGECELIEW